MPGTKRTPLRTLPKKASQHFTTERSKELNEKALEARKRNKLERKRNEHPKIVETYDVAIRKAYWQFIKVEGRIPTWSELGRITNTRPETVRRYITLMDLRKVVERITPYTERVLIALAEAAIYGSVEDRELYLSLVYGWTKETTLNVNHTQSIVPDKPLSQEEQHEIRNKRRQQLFKEMIVEDAEFSEILNGNRGPVLGGNGEAEGIQTVNNTRTGVPEENILSEKSD